MNACRRVHNLPILIHGLIFMMGQNTPCSRGINWRLQVRHSGYNHGRGQQTAALPFLANRERCRDAATPRGGIGTGWMAEALLERPGCARTDMLDISLRRIQGDDDMS